MAKSLEKLQAVSLRRKGESIKEIARKLEVSIGSVSAWTRDIELTDAQRAFLTNRQIAAGHSGRMKGTEANKEKKRIRMRLAADEALQKIQSISSNELFFLGLGLYWGEGVKSVNGSLSVTNSDPKVIQIMIRWFTECFHIEKQDLMPRVYISDLHRDREEIITKFWIKTLRIPRAQFRKMIFLDKGKKIYENRDVYYGVLTLRVAKGKDTLYKVLSQITRAAEVSKQAGVVQELERGTHKP
jgi:transposase-like protein